MKVEGVLPVVGGKSEKENVATFVDVYDVSGSTCCLFSHLRHFFLYIQKNIPGPPQITNYPDRGPELGGPILRKFTLG